MFNLDTYPFLLATDPEVSGVLMSCSCSRLLACAREHTQLSPHISSPNSLLPLIALLSFILALQFEPSQRSVLGYRSRDTGLRTVISGGWCCSAARPMHGLLQQWFSDLDSNSSTSWCSLQSKQSASPDLDHPIPAPMVQEATPAQSSFLGRSPRPLSRKSMQPLRSRKSSLTSETSHDHIAHASRDAELLLMSKEGEQAVSQTSTCLESVEALPQCDGWELQAFSTPTSRFSNPLALRPKPSAVTGRHTAETAETAESWKGRLNGLRTRGSQIFKRE